MELRPPILGSGCSNAYLDLRSQIVNIKGEHDSKDEEVYDFWTAKYLHECGHWLRFHGSTTGLYLTLLKLTRDLTAVAAFGDVSQETRRAIASRRRAGRPIWSFDVGYSPEPFGERFGLGAQFWLDLYYAYQILFDSASVAARPWDYAEALSYSLADVWLYASERSDFGEYPGNDTARAWLKGEFGNVGYEGTALSTRLLWECACTLDEISFARHVGGGASNDIYKMGMHKLSSTDYGLPLRLAKAIVGGETSMEMLWCVVDFATNPPLPFLCKDPQPFTWSEFYPPLRFTSAYEYVGDNPWLHDLCQGDDEGYLAVREHIREGVGLQYGLDELSNIDARSRPGVIAQAPSLPSSDLDILLGSQEMSHLRTLIFMSRSLLSWRDAHPSRILRNDYPVPATAPSGDDERTSLVGTLPAHPFVLCLSGRMFKHPALSEEHLNNFLVSMLASCALDDVLNSTGTLSQDHIPEPLRVESSALGNVVMHALERYTGIDWSSDL